MPVATAFAHQVSVVKPMVNDAGGSGPMDLANPETMTAVMETGKLNGNVEKVIPALTQTIHDLSAQLAVNQAQLAANQAQLVAIQGSLQKLHNQAQPQQDGGGPTVETKQELQSVIALPPPPTPPPMPVADLSVPPKMVETAPNAASPKLENGCNGSSKNTSNSPAYIGQLNDMLKAGVTLRKTKKNPPKVIESEEKAEVQSKLRSVKETVNLDESAILTTAPCQAIGNNQDTVPALQNKEDQTLNTLLRPAPEPTAPTPSLMEMPDLAPVTPGLSFPEKELENGNNEASKHDKDNSPACTVAHQLKDMFKTGIKLRKTDGNKPKNEVKEESVEKVEIKVQLRSIKKTVNDEEAATPKSESCERSNPILEELKTVKLRTRDRAPTESKENVSEKENTEFNAENTENQMESGTIDFNAKRKPPPNRKPKPSPGPNPRPWSTSTDSNVEEKTSINITISSVKKTTSLPEKPRKHEIEKIPMVEHIKNMMTRRKSDIYMSAPSTTSWTPSTTATASFSSETAPTEKREEVGTHVIPQSEPNKQSNLSDVSESQNEMSQTEDKARLSDALLNQVDDNDEMEVPESKSGQAPNENEEDPVKTAEDKLSPTSGPNNQVKVESSVHQSTSIPLPPPPPPLPTQTFTAVTVTAPVDKEKASVTTTENSIEYVTRVKKTNAGGGASTTTMTSSLTSKSSSVDGNGKQISREDLNMEIKTFSWNKLRSASSLSRSRSMGTNNEKKQKPTYDHAALLSNMMDNILRRRKKVHGDSDTDDDEEDSMSMDDAEWEE